MSSSNSPCAACKFLRRKCTQECVFAPYFPPDQPQKFSYVHKIFGASNVAKLLNDLSPEQREDAVNSLFYEAEARLRDPVYGCVGLISILQHRLKQIQHDLDSAKKELATYIGPQAMIPNVQQAPPSFMQHHLGLASPSSSSLIQNQNMMPILGINIPTGQLHGSGRMLLRDSIHHNIFEPQQFATAVSVRKHLPQQNREMFRTYSGGHHQQEILSFNNGFVSSAPCSVTSVTSTGFNNQMSGAATGTAVVSPSLALGSSYGAFQIHNNPLSHVLSQSQPSMEEPQTQPRHQQQPYEIAQQNQQRKNTAESEEGRSTEGPSSCF